MADASLARRRAQSAGNSPIVTPGERSSWPVHSAMPNAKGRADGAVMCSRTGAGASPDRQVPGGRLTDRGVGQPSGERDAFSSTSRAVCSENSLNPTERSWPGWGRPR